MQLVAVADMKIVEKDLRNAHAAMRPCRHVPARPRVAIHRDLGESEVLLAQQVLGPAAIGAGGRRIDGDLRHRVTLSRNLYMGDTAEATTGVMPGGRGAASAASALRCFLDSSVTAKHPGLNDSRDKDHRERDVRQLADNNYLNRVANGFPKTGRGNNRF